MRKHTIILAILVLGLTLIAQDIQQQAVSINIEVPVRVYKGDNFVDDLTINDFEVYEDGILQDVEAVYLINKRNIQTREEIKPFEPETSRSFFLVFEVVEYTPKLNEAIDYFFQNVLDPQDNLTIMTPKKTYRFKSEHLKTVSREQIINQLRGILRKDAWSASSEYRNLSDELIKVIESINIIVKAVENNSGRLRRLSRPTGGGNPSRISSSLDEAIEEDPLVDLGRYTVVIFLSLNRGATNREDVSSKQLKLF